MFNHTALAANFLILAAFCLFAYRDKYQGKTKKKIVLWTTLLIGSIMIHSYYIPMIIIIMVCTFIAEFVENKKSYQSSIATFFISCVCGIACLFLLGGITFSKGTSGNELSDFNANLNALWNPQGYSNFLKDEKLATNGEYEAFGYLGFGILLMSFLAVVLLINHFEREKFLRLIKRPNSIFMILCALLAYFLAIGTSVKLNSKVLFMIHYPSIIINLLSNFRSIGRMIWVVCYLVFFASIYIVSRYITNKRAANIIITICLMIQLLDFKEPLMGKFEYQEKSYNLNMQAWEEVLETSEHIVCVPLSDFSQLDFFKIAYIAKKCDCTLNYFYFARGIEGVKEEEEKYQNKLKESQIENGYTYLLKEENIELLEETNLNYDKIDGYLVCKMKNK